MMNKDEVPFIIHHSSFIICALHFILCFQGDRHVLIDGRNFSKLHSRWFIGAVVAALVATAWTVFAGSRSGRWPGGGSLSGLTLGIVAAVIFLFELALVAKKTKRFRTARWMFSAQTWLKAHIWLGLLTIPLVVLHSGGRIGGTLTTIFVVVYGVVIASGIWGLAMQNVLPRMLLDGAPAETVYSQIDRVGRQYATEARRLVLLSCGGEDELGGTAGLPSSARHEALTTATHAIHGAPRHVGLQVKRSPHPAGERSAPSPSPAVQKALDHDIGPFLNTGIASGSLGSRQRNQWYFDDLRLRVAPELRTLVDQLEDLCERRRQLNLQRRMHFWLHNWLWLHLPLSVALIILLGVHVIFALRFG
jgi:hypothetical protein